MGEAKFFLISPHHLQTSPFSPYSLREKNALYFFGDLLPIFLIADDHKDPIRGDPGTDRFRNRSEFIQAFHMVSVDDPDVGVIDTRLSS